MGDPALYFEAMAARIRSNTPKDFAGALLVVPPGGEEPIELLMIDPKQDLAHFWATIHSKVQVSAQEFQQRHQNPDPFRR
jgi:hypothetical protein